MLRSLGQGKTRAVSRRLLSVYLNDHLAGATLGRELVRRIARENAGNRLGVFLSDDLLPEIEQDRQALRRLMNSLDVTPSPAKMTAAWLAEKLGRLKLNGELRRYSPLSRLLELEGLAMGIEGKRALWLALATSNLNELDGYDFQALAARAESQRSRLEEHRDAAAVQVLAGHERVKPRRDEDEHERRERVRGGNEQTVQKRSAMRHAGPFDGIWSVRRVDGMLPPMPGVRKHISGNRGETRIGPLGAPFDVNGDTLRYRAPFHRFVDLLERAVDGKVLGTATFRGRAFGRFELSRIT